MYSQLLKGYWMNFNLVHNRKISSPIKFNTFRLCNNWNILARTILSYMVLVIIFEGLNFMVWKAEMILWVYILWHIVYILCV